MTKCGHRAECLNIVGNNMGCSDILAWVQSTIATIHSMYHWV